MIRQIRFEFKNLWTQLTVVSVISLVIFSSVFSFLALVNSETALTSQGEKIEGIGSYQAIRSSLGDIKGTMNQDYLNELFNEYGNSIEKQQLQDKIGYYLTRFTFSNYIINFAKYGADFTNIHMDLEANLTEKEFYEQYKKSMSDVIKSNNRNNFIPYTNEHMNKIDKLIDDVETPFKVDYYSGLAMLKWQFGRQFWFVLIVLTFALSSLFSKDSNNGISELVLSSKFGRRKNMNARLIAGNMFAVTVYLIFLATLLLEIGAAAGFQGLSQSIQNLCYTCTFNISVGAGIGIMLCSGLLTVLIISNFVMLISIIFKNAKCSTLVSVLVILLLHSSWFSNNTLLGQLNPISLATNFSLGIPNAFEIYYFVGDLVIPYIMAFGFIVIVYLVLIRCLTVVCYKKYKIN